MRKIQIEDRDLERTNQLEFYNIELVIDDHYPDRVEIYMLDPKTRQRVEGGTFRHGDFMNCVLKFYNENY